MSSDRSKDGTIRPLRLFSPLDDSSPSSSSKPSKTQLESTSAIESKPSAPKDTSGPTKRQTRELDIATGVAPARTVSITLGQMVPLLMDAVEKNRVWIEDFADENITIDADLYEILLAYQRMRNRDAA